jgi:hypothetical protein
VTETPQPPEDRPPAPPAQGAMPAPAAPAQPAAPRAADDPVHFAIDHQEEYHRLLPLVKWLLLIPHVVVLIFLGIGAFFAWIGAFFAILFTGRFPRGIFDYMVGVYRWGLRVSAYGLLMTDEYPPFSLQPDAGRSVRYDVEYPEEGVDNWRPLVHWLLIWPYLLVGGALVQVGAFLTFIAFFAILFTKRYPMWLFNFLMASLRWQARGQAYQYAMTTRYPPWDWEPTRPEPGR